MKKNLKKALEILSDEQRIAIHYRFWENMSLLEISNLLNISWDAADKLISQTLASLKNNLLEHPQEISLNKLNIKSKGGLYDCKCS